MDFWKVEQKIEFEKHPLHILPLGLEISCKACFFKNIFSGNLFFDVLITGLLDLLIYGPDSWRNVLKNFIQNQMDIGSDPNLVTRLLVTLE